MWVRDDGVWKDDLEISVRDDGQWKAAQAISAFEDGQDSGNVYDPPALRAPSSPRVVSRTATSILFGFTDESTGEDEFHVYVDEAQDGTVPSTTKASTGTEYTHNVTGLTQDTEYDLAVQACLGEGAGCGGLTEPITGLTMLATPTNVQAQAQSESRIDVSWNNNGSADEVRIYRSVNSTVNFTLLDTVSFTSSYSDTTVSSGNTYRYRIQKLTSNNESEQSASSNGEEPSSPAPDAPSSLLATASSFLCAIDLEWTNNDSYDSIKIYRGGSHIDTVSGSATSYQDSPLGQNDCRTYRVSGVAGGVESAQSNQSGDCTSPGCFQ